MSHNMLGTKLTKKRKKNSTIVKMEFILPLKKKKKKVNPLISELQAQVIITFHSEGLKGLKRRGDKLILGLTTTLYNQSVPHSVYMCYEICGKILRKKKKRVCGNTEL